MSSNQNEDVTLLPNRSCDPRILACGYDLLYEGLVLPMQVFIVLSERYVVLVDTLVNEACARALLNVAYPHLARRQLIVVNTHADFDHAWGNQLFADANSQTPAPILGTRKCADRMRSEAEHRRLMEMRQEQPDTYIDVRLCPPTVQFDETLVIDGGDLTLEFLATPGHAPGHCSIYIPEIDTMLAGDAAELPFPSPYDGGLTELRSSLQKLNAIGASKVLYCHVPLSYGPEVIAGNIAYFDRLEQACRAAAGVGISVHSATGEEIETLVDFPYDAALAPGVENWAPERYYRPWHRAAIRAMMQHVNAV